MGKENSSISDASTGIWSAVNYASKAWREVVALQTDLIEILTSRQNTVLADYIIEAYDCGDYKESSGKWLTTAYTILFRFRTHGKGKKEYGYLSFIVDFGMERGIADFLKCACISVCWSPVGEDIWVTDHLRIPIKIRDEDGYLNYVWANGGLLVSIYQKRQKTEASPLKELAWIYTLPIGCIKSKNDIVPKLVDPISKIIEAKKAKAFDALGADQFKELVKFRKSDDRISPVPHSV